MQLSARDQTGTFPLMQVEENENEDKAQVKQKMNEYEDDFSEL